MTAIATIKGEARISRILITGEIFWQLLDSDAFLFRFVVNWLFLVSTVDASPHLQRKEKENSVMVMQARPLGQGCGDSGTVLVVGVENLQAQPSHSRQNNNPDPS